MYICVMYEIFVNIKVIEMYIWNYVILYEIINFTILIKYWSLVIR